MSARKKKSECTPEEWAVVSAARRKSQYASQRHMGEKANAWLKKPWGRGRKRPAIDDELRDDK